jgi:general L-amino acid transport system substrate-binding protein
MRRLFILSVIAACAALPAAAPAQTLDAVRAAKHLKCGVVAASDDWNRTDIHGDLSDLGGEICKAVAIAILGDAATADVPEFPGEPEALTGLKTGLVDLLTTVSPDVTVATQYGVGFGPPIFFDTQRLIVSRAEGIGSVTDLRDRLICAMDMTEPQRTLQDEMTAIGVPFALMAHSEQGEMDAAIAVRHCSAGTGMETRLAQSRQNFHSLVSEFDFLPARFGLEPVAPAYRYGDQKFGLIVDWTVYALIEAEALGITKANVSQAMHREDARAERLLGNDYATAQALGLAPDWAAKVIAGLGNYGEIFDRTVAQPYHLDRALNRLWIDGGLMRPLPIR